MPLTLASPFLRTIDWAAHGVELVQPDAPLAHALAPDRAVVLERSMAAVSRSLVEAGGPTPRTTPGPGDGCSDRLPGRRTSCAARLLRPIVHVPRHPLVLARFGLPALLPAATLARSRFRGEPARALFAGLAAHSMVPLTSVVSASFGLVLGPYAHAVGWPMVRGGSQALADALAAGSGRWAARS